MKAKILTIAFISFLSVNVHASRNDINVLSNDLHYISANIKQNEIIKNAERNVSTKDQNIIALTIVGRNKEVIDRIIALQAYNLMKMKK